jgi:hypothetical protein
MARLRVEVDFDLEEAFRLDQDCLARSSHFVRDGYDIEMRLPPLEDVDPKSLKMDDLRQYDGYSGASGHVTTPSQFKVSFRTFRVCIREEAKEIFASAYKGAVTEEAKNLIINHQRKCRKIAESVATEFLDQLRYLGQTWLGPMGTIPCEASPSSTTYDDETGHRFKYSHGELIASIGGDKASLTSEMMDQITNALAASKAVPLPASFLADAQHFLACGLQSETQSDLQRAVLLAAIACELKVKETLREHALPSAKAMVEVLISSPRDFSMSAASLFDKPMKAAVGQSLREEDKELHKAIAQKDGLFPNRNAIAHSGTVVDPQVVKKNVQAAREVFDWLDKRQPLQAT